MTPDTNSTESTTRRATCAGRSDAISTASSNAVARKEIDPEPLIAGIFPLEDAPNVYEQLGTGVLQGVGFLFEYDAPNEDGSSSSERQPDRCADSGARHSDGRHVVFCAAVVRDGTLRAAPCGSALSAPGTTRRRCCFHTSSKEPGVELAHVATRRSLSAVNAQRKFRFRDAGTDSEALLEDQSIDAVFIVTRHSAHADLTCRALEAGKAVFVEKPLALTPDELDRILATVDETGNDRVMVGFNRRFAPLLVEMRARFGRSSEPTNARYLVNAGRLGVGQLVPGQRSSRALASWAKVATSWTP